MAVAQRDLEIPGGSTVEFVVDVIGGPTDLAGYTGQLHIKDLRTDILPIAEVPTSAIVVNPGTRQVTVRIPSSETETWLWERGVYDLLITGPTGEAWRLVEGRVTNSLPVTEGA
ncbi:MAG: hypothetical protein ABW022_25670 [Actinoplanes sp.]